MTVEEALDSLSKTDHDALMVAFEEIRAAHFVYAVGRFVGVHISADQDGLEILNTAGHFSEGLILGSNNG